MELLEWSRAVIMKLKSIMWCHQPTKILKDRCVDFVAVGGTNQTLTWTVIVLPEHLSSAPPRRPNTA